MTSLNPLSGLIIVVDNVECGLLGLFCGQSGIHVHGSLTYTSSLVLTLGLYWSLTVFTVSLLVPSLA